MSKSEAPVFKSALKNSVRTPRMRGKSTPTQAKVKGPRNTGRSISR